MIGMPLLLTGCAVDMCKSSINNLQEPNKIPKVVHISIDGKIKADAGGQQFLKDHVNMVNQVKSIKENCKK